MYLQASLKLFRGGTADSMIRRGRQATKNFISFRGASHPLKAKGTQPAPSRCVNLVVIITTCMYC